MSQDPSLEDRLEALGVALRGRASVTNRVMTGVPKFVRAGAAGKTQEAE